MCATVDSVYVEVDWSRVFATGCRIQHGCTRAAQLADSSRIAPVATRRTFDQRLDAFICYVHVHGRLHVHVRLCVHAYVHMHSCKSTALSA